MTYDFQLGHTCPHLTVEEVVPLGADRQSLVTRQPVASSSRVRITANSSVDIPSSGLQSPAVMYGAVSGPFRIPSYARELILASRTESITAQLPVGTRITASEIVRVVSNEITSQKAFFSATSENGFLIFRDLKDRGPSSVLRVSGSAGAILGFADQVRTRGKMVFPAWGFGEQSLDGPYFGPDVIRARYPKFTAPIRGNPVFKVTYTTYQQYCLRCQSYGIENDYRIGTDGNYLEVRDDDKLNQDALKILLTVRGSNPYFPEYGSTLLTRIGIKAVGAGVTTITEDVTRALTTLQRIQQVTGRYLDLTPKETLQSILSVATTPSPTDPTVFEVRIIASNASSEPILLRTVYAAPGSIALVGTNGKSLGLTERGLSGLTTIQGLS